MSFQDYYIERTGSQERIKNGNIAELNGKYSLLAIHVNNLCYTINEELKEILRAKGDNIEEIILSQSGSIPDFLKSAQIYPDNELPDKFEGNRYIFTGWDLRACMLSSYEILLKRLSDKTVEIIIPFGAAEDTKLKNEGGSEELNNILYFHLVEYYFGSAVKNRKPAALYFDGELIDLNGNDPKTILHFYSTTKKFLCLSGGS